MFSAAHMLWKCCHLETRFQPGPRRRSASSRVARHRTVTDSGDLARAKVGSNPHTRQARQGRGSKRQAEMSLADAYRYAAEVMTRTLWRATPMKASAVSRSASRSGRTVNAVFRGDGSIELRNLEIPRCGNCASGFWWLTPHHELGIGCSSFASLTSSEWSHTMNHDTTPRSIRENPSTR